MGKPTFPAPLVASLTRSAALIAAKGIGGTWDLGIDGVGFMLSTLDQEAPFEYRSYEIQSIPRLKPQIDDAEEEGEQTLSGWWARAQHSWHEGAGQDVFDSPFSSRFKFTTSKGLDPWTDGKLSLLKDTAELRNDAFDDHHLISTDIALFYTWNGNIKKDPDPDAASEGGEATVATHNGTLINSLTYDGESVYAAFDGGSLGIKKIDTLAFSAWANVNSHLAVDIIAFVKGRLMGAKGADLFEYDLSVTTIPERFHTDKASTWKWTAITESGPAIYFSGFAGDRSEIFAARLTTQDIPFASLATVGALRSVWQAPEGETIQTIKGYIGQAVLIGTNRGVRLANIVTGDGDLRVSDLIVETPNPVLWFEPQLEFAWFGWTKYDGTSSGLGRIHLGNVVYASDLMFTSQGDIKEIAYYANRLYFVTDEGATSRIIKENAAGGDLVASGTVTIQEIRFNTTERKVLRYLDFLTVGVGLWSMAMSTDGGAFTALASDIATNNLAEEVINVQGARFGLQFTLKRDPGDSTVGPSLLEWRLRGDPRAKGRFRYLVPVMIFDHLILANGREEGHTGFAWENFNTLADIYRAGSGIQFEPPQSAVPGGIDVIEVEIEDLRFKEFAPPQGGRGFGGVALVVMREVR